MSKDDNLYKNLKAQISKIARHNRQGSYKTKQRYEEAVNRFCRHIAKEYGVQKFTNIQHKHLESYVKNMQNRNLSASTIKTELSAIKFFYDKSGGKNNLESEKLQLERRSFGGVARAWSRDEYKRFRKLCETRGQARILAVATLARNEGLRIHETFKIDRRIVERAIASDILTIKGKGGKVRDVPLSNESKKMLKEQMQKIERGQKLFISEDEKTHLVIKQVQNFINRNREHFQEDRREINRTFHGLRHTYAQEQYNRVIEQKMKQDQDRFRVEYKARLEVSKLLGHERDEVTRIYLAK